MLYRGTSTFITSIGITCGGNKMELLPLPVMQQCATFADSFLFDCMMSKRGDWPWPPRSPDLEICDFFHWGYLKQQIWNVPHDEQSQNLEELRNSIVTACRNLEQRMIHDSFDAMVSWARQCIRARGHAIPNE
jgi:hypothetical protein